MHIKAVHEKIKDYACDQCEYRIGSRSNLNAHVKAVHEKVRTFSCGDCSFTTFKKSNLLTHIKGVHEKLKQFKCEECDYGSALKFNLETHIKSVHNKIYDIACDECDFLTAHKRSLKLHVKVVHQGIRDFVCQGCNYRTGIQSSLSAHIKSVHDKVKTFSCKKCDYKSAYSNDIKKHDKAIHNKVNSRKGRKVGKVKVKLEFEPEPSIKLEQDVEDVKNIKSEPVKAVEEKIFLSCKKCEYKSAYSNDIKEHDKVIHNKVNSRKGRKLDKVKVKLEFGGRAEPNIENEQDVDDVKPIKDEPLKAVEETIFSCLKCEYKSAYLNDIKKHDKAIHNKVMRKSRKERKSDKVKVKFDFGRRADLNIKNEPDVEDVKLIKDEPLKPVEEAICQIYSTSYEDFLDQGTKAHQHTMSSGATNVLSERTAPKCEIQPKEQQLESKNFENHNEDLDTKPIVTGDISSPKSSPPQYNFNLMNLKQETRGL